MRRTSSLLRRAARHDGAMARTPASRSADACMSRRSPPLRCAVVRAVALEAAVRQERLDVEVEVDPIGHAGDRRRLPVAGGHAEPQAQRHGTEGTGAPEAAGPERESAHGPGIMLPTRRRDPRRFACRARNLARNLEGAPDGPTLLGYAAAARRRGRVPRHATPSISGRRPRRPLASVRRAGHLLADRQAVPPRQGGRRDDSGRLLLRRQRLLHVRARRHPRRCADPFRAGAPDRRSAAARSAAGARRGHRRDRRRRPRMPTTR